MAEETGLIVPIGKCELRPACADAVELPGLGRGAHASETPWPRRASGARIVLDQQDLHALSAIKTAALSVSIFPDRSACGQQTACDACRNRAES